MRQGLSKATGGGFRAGAGAGAAIGGLFAATRYVADEWAGNKITAMQKSIDSWPEFARSSCQSAGASLLKESANELPKGQAPLVMKQYYWVGPPKSEVVR